MENVKSKRANPMTYQCWECKEIFTDEEVEEMTGMAYPQTLTTPAEYRTTCKCGGDDCMDEIDLCESCGDAPKQIDDECWACFRKVCEEDDDMDYYNEIFAKYEEAA